MPSKIWKCGSHLFFWQYLKIFLHQALLHQNSFPQTDHILSWLSPSSDRYLQIPLLKNYLKSHSALWGPSWLLHLFFPSVHVYWVSVGPVPGTAETSMNRRTKLLPSWRRGPFLREVGRGPQNFFSSDIISQVMMFYLFWGILSSQRTRVKR